MKNLSLKQRRRLWTSIQVGLLGADRSDGADTVLVSVGKTVNSGCPIKFWNREASKRLELSSPI